MNEIRLLPVKQITIPKGGKERSGTSPELSSDNTETEGLIPIAVRPDPTKQGQYLIISGEDRYHLAAKVLKQESIKCRVFKDMDEEEAQLAAVSESIRQKRTSNAERLELVGKWYRLYTKKYPDLIGRRASGNSRWKNRKPKADKAKPAAGTDPKHKSTRAAESDSPGGGRGTQTLLERLSTVTGMSKEAIARDLKIIKGFAEEQLKVLSRVDCAQKDMLRILELTKGNAGKRREVVSRIAKGMDPKKAIRIVGVPATSGVKSDSDADDEWFAKECGKFGESLGNPGQYKSDAILYRDILLARTEFRKKIESIIEKHKNERKNQRVGWLFLALHTLINLSHPSDWLLCPRCGGKGIIVSNDAECDACRGSCYQISAKKNLQGAKSRTQRPPVPMSRA